MINSYHYHLTPKAPDVASRGQVGQSDYPWEQLDEIELFKKLKP